MPTMSRARWGRCRPGGFTPAPGNPALGVVAVILQFGS
jgi:hypothetical protein